PSPSSFILIQTSTPPTSPLALHDALPISSVQQGALVIGKVPAASRVRHGGRDLRVTGYGSVAFGVARDQSGPVHVEVTGRDGRADRKSTRLNSSHVKISYAVFCLKKKKRE